MVVGRASAVGVCRPGRSVAPRPAASGSSRAAGLSRQGCPTRAVQPGRSHAAPHQRTSYAEWTPPEDFLGISAAKTPFSRPWRPFCIRGRSGASILHHKFPPCPRLAPTPAPCPARTPGGAARAPTEALRSGPVPDALRGWLPAPHPGASPASPAAEHNMLVAAHSSYRRRGRAAYNGGHSGQMAGSAQQAWRRAT